MSAVFSPGYAVGIGVGADLPVTLGDAAGVARLLPDPNRCAYPSAQVRLLTGEDVYRDAVLSALDWLAAAAVPDATALVYSSGQGVETPDYYLMPYGYNLGGSTRHSDPCPALHRPAACSESQKAVGIARLLSRWRTGGCQGAAGRQIPSPLVGRYGARAEQRACVDRPRKVLCEQ